MIQSQDLALNAINKSYGTFMAVEGVNLKIKQGQLVAFLGPSGCGKTTTLRIIAGLTEPSDGKVLIGGADVTQKPAHQRNIGMLFQNYALFPHLTIAENVAFGLKMRKVGKEEREKRVKAALELVQLSHLSERRPAALSGGQQQRVALARAVVIEPSLLLLDEPLGALDKSLREAMQVELRQIQRRLNITTVLVTHDQDEALTMADQIVIMNNGKVEQVGSPTEIYSRPVNKFVAGFIGASNFLTGNVVSKSDGAARIELVGGGEIIVDDNFQGQSNLNFTVRPEAVRIATDRSEINTDNWTSAVIEDVIYRGQVTHVLMRRNNGEAIVAYLPNRTAATVSSGIEAGKTVAAYWQRESNHHLASVS